MFRSPERKPSNQSHPISTMSAFLPFPPETSLCFVRKNVGLRGCRFRAWIGYRRFCQFPLPVPFSCFRSGAVRKALRRRGSGFVSLPSTGVSELMQMSIEGLDQEKLTRPFQDRD